MARMQGIGLTGWLGVGLNTAGLNAAGVDAGLSTAGLNAAGLNSVSQRNGNRRPALELVCLSVAIGLLYAAERSGKSCFQIGSDGTAVLVSEALIVIAYAMCAILWRTFERFFMSVGRRQATALIAAGAASALGWAMIALSDALVGSGVLSGTGALAWAGLALHSLTDSFLLLACLCSLCRGRALRAAAVLPAAHVLSGVILCILEMTPLILRDACTIVAPLAAVALFMAGERSDANEGSQGERAPDGRRDVPAPAKMPLWPFVLIAAYDSVCHFIVTGDAASGVYAMVGYLIVPALALACALLKGNNYSPLSLNKAALPCVVAALMCLTIPGLGSEVAAFLANVGSAAFYLFVLVTFIMMCQRHEFNPVSALATLLAVEHVSHFLGDLVGQLFCDLYPTGGVALQVFAVVMATAMVLVATLFMNDLEIARIFGLVPQAVALRSRASEERAVDASSPVVSVMSSRESVAWQCASVARAHSLTVREEEVLELMMLGMDNAQISEAMTVLPGTVRTHVSHICRKLGAETRSEAVEIALGA